MNCSQANKISIVDFLSRSGLDPVSVKGRNHIYYSPIRKGDKDPSFAVDPAKNCFYDFGTGEGGNLIDLVCKLCNVSVTGALMIVSGDRNNFSFSEQKKTIDESTIEIKHLQSLQNKALIQYLESRKIPAGIASKYVNEAYYNVTNPETGEIKKYFSLAFKNQSGGYELRSKYFKGCSSPKDITSIPGSLNAVNVFEGFIDFLSLLVHIGMMSFNNTVIVLNSLNNVRKIDDLLPNFKKINLYLDNDESGNLAACKIMEKYTGAVNQSEKLFPGFKDVNDFINNKPIKNQ